MLTAMVRITVLAQCIKEHALNMVPGMNAEAFEAEYASLSAIASCEVGRA
jgi:hypothetical protein